MLQSLEPRAFIAPHLLRTIAQCPHCGTERTISDGVVALLHYSVEEELKYSLVWVCHPLCILGFEHSRFMGQA